jgi:N-acetylmuramoyl-L-alanine amidase
MNIKQVHCPYFNKRGDAKPSFLILHYTATKTAKEALDDYFLHPNPPNGEVSAHYLIDEDGLVSQLVEEEKRAYHAGVSYWRGTPDLNTHSIGIEIVNPGHDYGYIPFTEKQMKAVLKLSQDILARHNIPASHVLGHSDVALSRKIDPGELFDWEYLAKNGVGVWPDPLKEDFEKASLLIKNDKKLKKAFSEYGYDPKEDLKLVVTQFQRHFHPEVFIDSKDVGVANKDTVARLCSLLRVDNQPKA